MLLNKKTLFKLASLLSLATSALAQEDAIAPEDSDVVKLSGKDFESFIGKNNLVMAEFFAPWCGHCKNLAPEYVKAAEKLKEHDIYLAQVDCTENQELCMEHQIRGYPTIKIFKNGNLEEPKDYQGARKADAMIDFMIKQSLPTVMDVASEDELDSILLNATLPVVINNDVENFNETFHKMADKLFSDYVFVSYPLKKNPKLSVILSNEDDLDNEPIVYDGDLSKTSEEDFIKWLKVQSLPFFGEINGETFNNYFESKLPLAYLFYNSQEELEKYSDFLTKLGEKHRGKLNFGALDAQKFGRHADNLNMKEQFPLFVIHDMDSNYKYGLKQLADEEFEKLTAPIVLKEKEIKKLVEDVLAGKAEPIVKSEPIPESQDSSVMKLVAHNHDEIIKDPKKDVLVKYYAPWCGHCKNLAPIYVDLADLLANDKSTKDKFVIAEIDATLNDVASVDIEGYPTIILYPSGMNAEPVTFQTKREIEDFLNFLEKNGGNSLNAGKLAKQYQKELEEKKAEEEEKEKAAAAEKAANEAEDESNDDIEHDEL
ncbi:hypothetical protein Kpol_2000p104 [Vanderwaltozyma polyspora DSM 70294]|uniref:Protein disulfide-isomerase n=1 Tax=Vanderwaltozyma polyspora (strain ATCC 22028 / DSM 70294 / BCRC 21397 / CBS 2163 / NBRC 10782 / NRRL Y-8283 / UCD 57-17) TaxID=436907 RepID=A7TFB1_VANPO|nr:uncharacterized protein Kpol_2000p104 [Vanderwaltozyma polyspora DSM 70294]EDO19136.1 hypothetical protein Kpol_2000p104 [Vanderwaltozyma polyspora DSM 70294]